MIVGWTNPLTKRLVPLDDPGMELIMPRAVLRYMCEKEKSDVRHSGTNITVTSGNGCPRALAINRMLDTHPNPQKMWPMTGGTMLHKFLGELVTNDEWYSEENYPDKCEFVGQIYGVAMGCKIDLIRKDYSAIWDFKTSFGDKTKWMKLDEVATIHNVFYSSYAIQLNLCAELVHQQTGEDMSRAELAAWVVSKRWQKMIVERASMEECLNTEVGSGKYTKGKRWKYGELLDHIKRMFQSWEDAARANEGKLEEVPIEVRKEIVGKLPMFGESMFNNRAGGNMCESYCAVQKDCYSCGGGL